MPSNRRDFLKSSLGVSALLSLAPTVPSFLQRAALAAAEREGEPYPRRAGTARG